VKFPYGVMAWPLVYRLWEAPFVEEKFAPVLAHNDLSTSRRVLDLGCGPGINTHHFSGADYLGVDINPRYIESAERRHKRRFVASDAAEFVTSASERFDFILVNSFLHHIDSAGTAQILSNLRRLLTNDGHVHILDLVLPEKPSVSRFLARADRGRFSRPLSTWNDIFGVSFLPLIFETYDLRRCGTTLWKMVYFKGRARP
jgi:SAM-dependent methyltransferase